MVSLRQGAKLRGAEDDLKVDKKQDKEEQVNNKGRGNCQDMKKEKKINSCKKYEREWRLSNSCSL